MIKFEDILDAAARYLRGEMDEEEKTFFEELLEQYPHLKEDLRLMELVRLGLSDMQVADDKGLSSGQKDTQPKKRRQTWRLILFSFLGLLFFSLLSFLAYKKFFSPPEKETPQFQFVQILTEEGTEGKESFIVEHFGGDEDAGPPDRGHVVQWTRSGEVAFGASFTGTGQLGRYTFSSKGKENIIFGKYHIQRGFEWMAAFGGEEIRDLPKDIAIDREDNLILTGEFGGTANFGNYIVQANGNDDVGNHDFFIAKYTPAGSLVWMDHGGGARISDKETGANSGTAVTVDGEDNILVIGMYVGTPLMAGTQLPVGGPNEDLFLIKYNPDGKPLWVKTITGNYMTYGFDLSTDAAGNIFVTGSFGHHNLGGQVYFESDTLTSLGGRDIFLAKFDPQGKLIWVRQAGSGQSEKGYDEARSISTDEEGNSVISGQFVGKAVFGDQTINSFGGRDAFWAKYDTEGNVVWVHHAGGDDDGQYTEWAHGLDIDESGFIYLTGSFKKTAVFGDTTLTTSGDHNFFVAKCNPDGEVIWVKKFEELDSFQRAEGLSIDVNENHDIVVTGFFSGTIQIGERTLKSQSSVDIFILVFNEKGEIVEADSMIAYM